MADSDRAVTRDDLELAIWRITGTRDAEKVDRILDMAERYANGMTDRYVAGMVVTPTPGYAGDGHRSPSLRGGQHMPKEGHPPFSGEKKLDFPGKNSGGGDAMGSGGDQQDFDQLIREVQSEASDGDSAGHGGNGLSDTDFKVCSGCGINKLLEDYARDRSKASGHRSKCKPCSNAEGVKRRAAGVKVTG